jgi:hypothetical protein
LIRSTMRDDAARRVAASDGAAREPVRSAALARVRQLYCEDRLTLERYDSIVEQLLAARSYADLEQAMRGLPPLVRLTPPSRRLDRPLMLRVPDADLQLAPGWQLASRTTVATSWGRARLDLAAASWDDERIELRLETWGSIEVLVPRGVEVQIAGGAGAVRIDALSPPLPGGPLLRVYRFGPTGLVRVRHPPAREHGRRVRSSERRIALSPRRIAARRGSRRASVVRRGDRSR